MFNKLFFNNVHDYYANTCFHMNSFRTSYSFYMIGLEKVSCNIIIIRFSVGTKI